jgi:anti-sigma factor RsiW
VLSPPHSDEEVHQLHLFAARAVEPGAAPVEEHLLVCEECRTRLAGWGEDVGAMRAALPDALHLLLKAAP